MDVMKHFKFVGIVVMALLAVVIIYGMNRAESLKKIEQPKPKVGNHPNLSNEIKLPVKKGGCNVCQQKKMKEYEQKMQQSNQQKWM